MQLTRRSCADEAEKATKSEEARRRKRDVAVTIVRYPADFRQGSPPEAAEGLRTSVHQATA